VANFAITDGSSFGHSAFVAGVRVTIVLVSNVGVKVGIVGNGVIVVVGVSVGTDVLVFVGKGDGVDVALLTTGTGAVCVTGEVCPQAVKNNIPPSRLIKIGFHVFRLIIVLCSCFVVLPIKRKSLNQSSNLSSFLLLSL
jgi:hypothetical protein